jgi:hypothetical protein
MKANFAKTNPAFKRAQPLPAVLNVHPLSAGGAARRFSEFTQPQTDLNSPPTNLIVCAQSVSQDFHASAVRSLK